MKQKYCFCLWISHRSVPRRPFWEVIEWIRGVGAAAIISVTSIMKINGLANTAKTVPEKEDMPFSSHDATRQDTLREKSARMLSTSREVEYTLLQPTSTGWAGVVLCEACLST